MNEASAIVIVNIVVVGGGAAAAFVIVMVKFSHCHTHPTFCSVCVEKSGGGATSDVNK